MRFQPRTLDFSQAESNTAVEEVVMNKTQLAGDAEIQLRFVKFQDVQNIQIFVQVGHTCSELDKYVSMFRTTRLGKR